MLCGYQLNKIKFEFENFLAKLKDAGADVEFVFKKTVSDDKEFLRRRLQDYRMGCEVIKTIRNNEQFEQLQKLFHNEEKFPFNTMILVSIIQSSEKFGIVHGCNSIKGKPTAQQTELARQKDAVWILGLDTFYFLMPGKWKIWCDSKLNMEKMTVQELDPNLVMTHFGLTSSQAPLFACLIGDLQSHSSIVSKVSQHFGSKSVFPNAAKFIRRLTSTKSEEMLREVVDKIFANKVDPAPIVEDFKKSIKAFEINEEAVTKIDVKILEMVKNDFVSIAEEILLNMPIFINQISLDMRNTDMKPINDLVLPIIQKTCGILLKHLDDHEPRKLVLIKTHGSNFSSIPIDVKWPDFEVPSLKVLLAGEMSTYDKMNMLYWITDMSFKDFELMVIPEEYVVDCIILLYLIKNESLALLDARCILKTLVDARRRSIPLECSTDYPEKINERAYRCSFLYSKMYFYMHSCLTSLGMKNLCPEIQFDGVYFQKIYDLNIIEDEKEGTKNDPEEVNKETDPADASDVKDVKDFTILKRAEILDEFAAIIRM